ncbi:MAG: tetratricopeptide repeat protein [Anaerolineaceae bacterium]|nr:tetratricopeptide repeat protein [Anaerolineaceae bacterium]
MNVSSQVKKWGLILLPALLAVFFQLSPRPAWIEQKLHAAQVARQAQQPAALARTLNALAAVQPWRSGMWLELAELAQERGDLTAAVNAYQQAGQWGRLSNDQRLALGRALVQVGQPDEALKVWGAQARMAGADEQAYAEIVSLNRALGRLPAARQAAREWKHTWPLSPVALYQAGILDLLDQTQEARRDLEECRRLDEDFAGRVNTLLEAYPEQGGEDAYAYLKAGRALADLGEWDLAAEAFRTSLALEPAYAEAWALLGESRQQLGQDGYPQLQQALELNPRSTLVQVLAALYWRRQGQPERALAYLRQAVTAEPEEPVWQIEMGNTFDNMGDSRLALQYYQKAVALRPRDPVSWRLLAEFSASHGIQLHDVGLPAARQVLALAPAQAESYDLMGSVLLQLNDPLGAERFLHQALRKDAELAAVHLHLGQLYLNTGNMDLAYIHLKKAVSLTIQDPASGYLADRLLVHYFPGSG